MVNKISNINVNEASKIIQEAKKSLSTHIAEINGKNIQSWIDYSKEIEIAFKFPTCRSESIDFYLDFMRDLDWLEKDAYILMIHNYEMFLINDLSTKKMIMDDFNEIIFPWWQEEVVSCVVGGKIKPFNVYAVE